MNRKQEEKYLAKEIIKSLRRLGGQATRKELFDDLNSSDNAISEEFMNWTKLSKNGNSYRPFVYAYNFTTTYLALTGYITKPRRAYIEITNKGMTCDLPDDFGETVAKLGTQILQNKKEPSPNSMDQDSSFQQVDFEQTWKDELLHSLRQFTPAKFEQFSRLLVRKMGVTMDEKIGIQVSNDGGLDGFGYITSQDDFRTNRVAIQAKRWQGTIQASEIDKFRGAMDKYDSEFGIFITTSSFSRGAIQAARQGTRVITLIDGDKIADLVAKYKLYVNEIVTYELDDYYKDKG